MNKPALIALLAALPLWAAPAVNENAANLTLKNIILEGGNIMFVLLALSVITMMLIFFYLLTLRRKMITPVRFLRAAQDAADAGDLAALAEAAQKSSGSTSAKIVAAACEVSKLGGKFDADAFQKAMEEEGSRQSSLLWSRLQYLIDISAVAPMLGLLGTVWGMMVSFTGLESGINMINKADRLASGVSQAMFTTFGGLIIGIAAVAAYAFFRGRLSALIARLEADCANIFNRLAANPNTH